MANLQSTVDLIFNAVDDASATVGKIGDSIESFGDGIGTATQPVADFTKGILAFEAGVAAAGIAMVKISSDAAQKFELAFSEIATLTGENKENLAAFREQLLEYASGSVFALDQVTGAVYAAISAGISYGDSLDFLNTVEQLSIAGKSDLNTTTLALVSTLNAYGKGVDDAAKFSDIFITTVQKGQTTLPELASGLANVTSIAGPAGVSFEEVAAAIATVTASGSPTSEAITSITAAISAIIKPSGDAAKLAQDLGLNFNATALQSVGLSGVLNNVATATGGNVEEMSRLFGSTEALRAVLPLTGIAADKFSANLDAMRNSTGATEQAAAQFSHALDNVGNAFQVLLVNLGSPLLEPLDRLEDAFVSIFSTIGTESKPGGSLSGISELFVELAGRVADAAEVIARNLPAALALADLSGFKNGVMEVVSALDDFIDIDLSTPEGLAKAITGLGEAFQVVGQYTVGVIQSFDKIISQVAPLVSDIAEGAVQFGNLAGQFGGFATAANIVAPVIAAVGSSISAIALAGPATVAAIKGLGGELSAVLSAAGSLNTALGSAGLLGTIGQLAGVAGVGLLTYELTKFGLESTGLNLKINDLVDELTGLNKTTQEAPVYLSNEAYGFMKLRIEAEQYLDSIKDTKETQEDIKNITDRLTESIEAQGKGYDAATGEIIPYNIAADKARDAVQRIAFEFDQAQDSARGWHVEIKDGVTTYTQAGGKIKETNEKIADSSSKAVEKTQEFLLEIAKLKSQENQVAIQVSGDIAVAQIEADAKRVESAFNSVNVGIQSTGDSITGLLSTWAGIKSDYDKYRFEDYINQEFEFRAQQFELQKELIEQQLEYFRDKSRFYNQSLSNGLAIKVQADGLEPYLRAIMHEIFSAITAEAIGSNAEFLLAIAQGQAEAA